MSLSNPSRKQIEFGEPYKIKIDSKFRSFVEFPLRKLICSCKGHTEVTIINEEIKIKTCLRCWKRFKS